MTGDGSRSRSGGVLAADAALDALAGGWGGVHERLRGTRRREFSAKWRFNRTLRGTVGLPSAVRAGALAARVWPGALRRIISTAGDCGIAASQELRTLTSDV